MSPDDRQAFEQGVKTMTDVGGALLSLPITLLEEAVKSLGDASAGVGATSDSTAFGGSQPATAKKTCEPNSRVSALDPWISLVESFIQITESTALLFGGRSNLPGEKPKSTSSDRAGTPRGRLFAAPIASTIYLVGDLAESFKQGLENVSRTPKRP